MCHIVSRDAQKLSVLLHHVRHTRATQSAPEVYTGRERKGLEGLGKNLESLFPRVGAVPLDTGKVRMSLAACQPSTGSP
jgi:hypothetical protein